jgi:hypothetical protein
MSDVAAFPDGGYRYIPGVFQYSAGVTAADGFSIERARFGEPIPLADAFSAIEVHLGRIGCPLAAFCACELRSPAPFTEEGFHRLQPAVREPARALRHRPERIESRADQCLPGDLTTFRDQPLRLLLHRGNDRRAAQLRGGGEQRGARRQGQLSRPRHSHERPINGGPARKARWVLGEMERRMSTMGFSWSDATDTQPPSSRTSLRRAAPCGRD